MSEIAVALAVIAALVAGVLVGMLLASARRAAARPTERVVTHSSSGALVPVSRPRPLPDLATIELVPLPEPVGARAALVIDFRERLSSELDLARVNGALTNIKGPAAAALASLLSNERLMNTVMGKAGYYVVKASPGAKWMTRGGQSVAQEVGKRGAGVRALVVGGGTYAMAPEIAAVALAATAEYILTAKIERVGKVADLIHHRQLSEALSTADQVLQLVGRLREYDDPRDWPEVLIAPLVDAHHELSRQAFAADRLRASILGNDPDGTMQPSNPAAGDKSSAFHELAAGYELHAVAAQAAAARLVHAQAHGDAVTTTELEWQLGTHIDQLREHHRAIDAVTNRRSRRFKQGWGRALSGLRETHADVIALVEAEEYEFLLALDGPTPEMLALPAASVDLRLMELPQAEVPVPE